MAQLNLNLPDPDCKDDYIGAFCLVVFDRRRRRYKTIEALADIEDFGCISLTVWNIHRVGKNRYWRVLGKVDGKRMPLARFLMGDPVGFTVDHKSRNTLDDRRGNLRVCTVADNNCNRPQIRRAKSRFKGVAWNPSTKNWQVYSGRRGQKVMVGRFADEVEAARAYNEFAKKAYGAYAYLNPV